MSMIADVFPGQGSQRRGMGKELFDTVPEYRVIEQQVDAEVGYSIRELCVNDTESRLGLTQFTQPCLYIVNALHHYKERHEGRSADFLAGHSLGEYNALHAAGAFDLLTGLRLVKRRGELMSQAQGGAMAAVIGLDGARIFDVLMEFGLQGIDIANHNSHTQTVISGPTAKIKEAQQRLEQAGAHMVIPLHVSAAFHSRYMTRAAHSFAEFLASIPFRPLNIPVIANVIGRPYPMQDTEVVKSLLARQVDSSVLWKQSVRYLIDQGVSEFRERGPGNVLTRLIAEIKQLA